MNQATETNLNLEQQEAASHVEGPLLVIAGAGSGKTRIVTQRITALLELGVPAAKILGVTFTNKAAGEMRERVRQRTKHQVLISTFHSLGARILRESIAALGYKPDFTIYDEEDCHKILATCLKSMGVNDRDLSPKAFKQLISGAKAQLQMPQDIQVADTKTKREQLLPEIYALYQTKLKEANAVDFDDLLFLTVRLFRECPEVCSYYQNYWSFVLVDEYQDTNFAQYLIIRTLVELTQNLFVVGDPDQSIYSWRGADINNILNFEKDFVGAKVVRLEQNYRSTNNILNASNALIQNNQRLYEKKLWSDQGAGEKISVHAAMGDQDEAQFVVQCISKHKREGISLNEMVIFYRTNFQSRTFEDALLQHNIPYVIVGGVSFYQRREIRDILSFLRMAHSGTDLVAFTRTVNLPKRGMGDIFLEKLLLLSGQLQISIYDLCLQLIAESRVGDLKLSAKQKEGLKEYIESIDAIKQAAQESVRDAVDMAIKHTRYLAYLKASDAETYDDRKANLDELVSKAAEWETMVETPTLSAFLEDITLKPSSAETQEENERVSLMTIHNGKGLEFKVAFVVGMEEDLFPHANSRNSFAELEEERRLCYVGMTRAKQYLYLTTAQWRYLWGSLRMMRPSRFLKEIPTEYIQKVRANYSGDFEPRQEPVFATPITKEHTTQGSELTVGDRAFHATFGAGTIKESYQGSMGLTYKVLFDRDGVVRTLVAKYANLSRC